ncbi:hypothetical protein AWC38_SpisGene10163 [Stylophora pistillata]|uniref:Uncharacterized protein n=1 Tax=Stylophora pistillata TaxID=50429 RepID=A0A2B4S836_STYPI|nr:hypothetical protein AWC38_SpisGene10163 [Stylophora pistillata]
MPIEILESWIKERCLQKILVIGVDPASIPAEKFSPKCLPPVEVLDLLSYLVLETSFYTKKQFKAFKSLEAFNQMVSGFVTSVVGKVIAGNLSAVMGTISRLKLREEIVLNHVTLNLIGYHTFTHPSALMRLTASWKNNRSSRPLDGPSSTFIKSTPNGECSRLMVQRGPLCHRYPKLPSHLIGLEERASSAASSAASSLTLEYNDLKAPKVFPSVSVEISPVNFLSPGCSVWGRIAGSEQGIMSNTKNDDRRQTTPSFKYGERNFAMAAKLGHASKSTKNSEQRQPVRTEVNSMLNSRIFCWKKKAPSRNLVCSVKQLWREMPKEMVRNSFLTCGISNELDGTKNNASYEEAQDNDAEEDKMDEEFDMKSEDEP